MASRKHHQQGDLPKPGHFEHVALNSWFLSSNRGEPPITPIVYGYIWLSIPSFIMFYLVYGYLLTSPAVLRSSFASSQKHFRPAKTTSPSVVPSCFSRLNRHFFMLLKNTACSKCSNHFLNDMLKFTIFRCLDRETLVP